MLKSETKKMETDINNHFTFSEIKNKDIQDKLKSGKYEPKKIDRIDLITCDGKIVLTYDIFMQILAWYTSQPSWYHSHVSLVGVTTLHS